MIETSSLPSLDDAGTLVMPDTVMMTWALFVISREVLVLTGGVGAVVVAASSSMVLGESGVTVTAAMALTVLLLVAPDELSVEVEAQLAITMGDADGGRIA